MAHELTMKANGRAEMAYIGEKPWHGLGQALRAGASIEEWRTASGMEWTINASEVLYNGSDGIVRAWGEKRVLTRSDTHAPLGIVSDGYRPVNPGEILEFFRDLTEGMGFTLETAGTLKGGRVYWALARIAPDCKIFGRDAVGGFLLLSSSADGSRETQARFTAVRVVCNNTITIAFRGKADVSISHRSEFNAARVKRDLGVGVQAFEQFLVDARRMAETPVTPAHAAELLRVLIKGNDKANAAPRALVVDLIPQGVHADVGKGLLESMLNKPVKLREEKLNYAEVSILELFNGKAKGSEFEESKGTAWGYLNAVTEFVDHQKRAQSVDNRMMSAWFGPGEELKNRAAVQVAELIA